jgi:hypothetical protein
VTWTSAAETLLYPFWVAAVMVLYRSLRPWTDDWRDGAQLAQAKASEG